MVIVINVIERSPPCYYTSFCFGYKMILMDINPIYLFADSQLLFWQCQGKLFLQNIIHHLTIVDDLSPKAAYIGASNGDMPEFYDIFVVAMASVGITDCKMISAFYDSEDKEFINDADIILLAGGDVTLGWKTFHAVGLDKVIRQKYQDGCLLIGVSAGAVQLGMCTIAETLTDTTVAKDEVINTLQIIALAISVHDEKNDWHSLKQLVSNKEGFHKGIGIPTGGGLIYHNDLSVEPIRYPLQELIYNAEENTLTEGLIYPPVTSE